MKYRIKSNSSDIKPYRVQRKNEKSLFPIWRTIESFQRQHDAENLIKRSVERHSKHQIGDIIYEYDETDLVVDKLKNDRRRFEESDSAIGAPMGQQTPTLALWNEANKVNGKIA